MRKRSPIPLVTALLSLAPLLAALPASAAITDQIEAHIPHSFTVGEVTLPAGEYYFRMVPDFDLTVMRVTSADGKTSAEFLVREAKAPEVPQHNEFVFDRYGNKEFLTKVFEVGAPLGVAVDEPSRAQLRLEKRGQHGVEHSEAQT